MTKTKRAVMRVMTTGSLPQRASALPLRLPALSQPNGPRSTVRVLRSSLRQKLLMPTAISL
ncbi:hypothetical protein LPJ73_004404, partial [Coemansia sp. RSA 2703]